MEWVSKQILFNILISIWKDLSATKKKLEKSQRLLKERANLALCCSNSWNLYVLSVFFHCHTCIDNTLSCSIYNTKCLSSLAYFYYICKQHFFSFCHAEQYMIAFKCQNPFYQTPEKNEIQTTKLNRGVGEITPNAASQASLQMKL